MLLLFKPFHLLNPYNLKSAIGTAAYNTDSDYWKTAKIAQAKTVPENMFFNSPRHSKSEENYILIYLSGTQANLLWTDV